MKIKKNGNILTLSESDLKKIIKKVITEQDALEDALNDVKGSNTDIEYNEAVEFCEEVENWWEGSDSHFNDPERDNDTTGTNYVDFFSKYNKTMGTDLDKQAAEAYGHMIFHHLKRKLSSTNRFYKKIENWLKEIVDNIDSWFQEPKTLPLQSNDGRVRTFMVDPEIDVDGIFGL